MVKVIGIGDNVVDKYIHTRTMYPGGNALNFSVFAKKLGAVAAYIGNFGTDIAAEHIRKILGELDIDISRCRTYEGENGFARVSLQDGERVFLPGNGGGINREHFLHFDAQDLAYIKQFDLIHSSCYSYMEDSLDELQAAGIPISFDFSDKLSEAYMEKVCPKVNFAFLSCSDMTEIEVKGRLEIAKKYGCDFTVASRGDKGAIFYDGESFIAQEAYLVKPVDTMGAGDSFITAFLFKMLEKDALDEANKETIKESMEFAAKRAAETCGVNGTFGYGAAF